MQKSCSPTHSLIFSLPRSSKTRHGVSFTARTVSDVIPVSKDERISAIRSGTDENNTGHPAFAFSLAMMATSFVLPVPRLPKRNTPRRFFGVSIQCAARTASWFPDVTS